MARLSVVAALFATPAVAWAQVTADTPAAAPAPASGASAAAAKRPDGTAQTLDQVTITANRRSERALDVAGSVNAVSGARLERLNAQSLSDIATFVPGLQVIDDRPGQGQQVIRGITTGYVQTSATTAIYLDESPISFTSNFAAGALFSPDPDPLDLDRLEVLKGPQGSLYGASALGGLIKYVTIAPDLRQLEGKAEVGVDQIRSGKTGSLARAALSVPIVSDLFAVRASVFHRKEGGYLDNVASGKNDVNGYTNEGGRISALLKPTREFSARLTGDYQVIDFKDGSQLTVDPTTLKPTVGDLKVDWQAPMPQHAKTWRSSLQLDYDLGFASLLSVTSFIDQKQDSTYDYTRAFGPLFGTPVGANTTTNTNHVENKKTTQEFRLTSPSGRTFDWLAGLFYTKETNHATVSYDDLNGPPGGPFTPVFPNAISVTQDASLREYAAYGNATFRITESIDLQGGLRYSRIDQDLLQSNYTVFGQPAAPDNSGNSSERSTTWMLSPRWKLDRNQTTYIRVAGGYRPGGPNQPQFAPSAPQHFKSDKIVNYEVGWKGVVPAARFDFSAALFRINWKDIQVLGIDPTTGFGFYTNGGKAHTQGLELETSWRPVTGLRTFGAATFMQGKLDEDFDVSGVQGKKGDSIPYVPRVAFAIGADYSFPVWDEWQATVGASERHVGSRNPYYSSQTIGTGVTVTPGNLPSYDLFDVHASFGKGTWTISTFVKNVFDKRGALSLNGVFVGPGSTPGSASAAALAIAQPRTFGISLRADF